MLSLSRSGSVSSNPDAGRPSIQGPGINVLVCEDDELVACDLMAALEKAGINALGPVATLEAGASYAADFEIDAAIVDLNLQDGRTGIVLARRLYERGVAVILCSGDSLEPSELDDIQHIFVPKPMAAEVLCECVRKIAVGRASLEALENG